MMIDNAFSITSSDEEEEDDGEEEGGSEIEYPVASPLIKEVNRNRKMSIFSVVMEMLRRSLVACSVEPEGVDFSSSSIEIGCPTDVRHVAHVTFDRFHGFIGLPKELEPELPQKVPSASVSVFGVSANSMQCKYDKRGNSVPTILLMMQGHLYLQGGLQTEGIFRINGENSQEFYVREQLNKGVVPQGVDLHCLAGLIKAWFRELPHRVLDSLTPEQVMHCNTEEECTRLVSLLPLGEAALLDWVVNLMTDVVQHESYNKMNAHSISMVFAPNMTQMADPLTALICAVQVMNLLRSLILKTLRERNESTTSFSPRELCSGSMTESEESTSLDDVGQHEDGRTNDVGFFPFNLGQFGLAKFVSQQHQHVSQQGLQTDPGDESFKSFEVVSEVVLADLVLQHQRILQQGSHADPGEESFKSFEQSCEVGLADFVSEQGLHKNEVFKSKADEEQSHQTASPSNNVKNWDKWLHDKFRLKKGVKKICWPPIFRSSKLVKKADSVKAVEERT